MFALVFFSSIALSHSLVIERPDSLLLPGWTELGRTDPFKPIKLTFALKNENTDVLEQLLLDVSTPGNEQYGNHRTIHSLQQLIAPSDQALNTIQNWLFNLPNVDPSHIIKETANGDLWSIMTNIETAEELLNCQYYDYQSEIDNKTIVSRVHLGSDYHLPSPIREHMYFVMPTHRFPNLNPRFRTSKWTSKRNTPVRLKDMYNVGDAKGSSANNSQAIASFIQQFYDMKDLENFWKKYNLLPCNVTNVPGDQKDAHRLEASLDTQYLSGMGEQIPMQVWWTGNKSQNFSDQLMQWTVDVLNTPQRSLPDLFSVSYGWPESFYGAQYITKMNNNFMVMGAAGITLLCSSGDSGASGDVSPGYPWSPLYPASSLYVTSVGGLTGGTPGNSPLGEEVWPYGGGGFSVFMLQPSWQKDAVAYYLSNNANLPNSTLYNASGRGYPDVASQATACEVVEHDIARQVEGTSCSSPTVGGIVALLNDLRAQNGMNKLGFFNPLLYKIAAEDPTAFNDCTKGSNGFPAVEKWDPASGYGSPNYTVLAKKVLETGRIIYRK